MASIRGLDDVRDVGEPAVRCGNVSCRATKRCGATQTYPTDASTRRAAPQGARSRPHACSNRRLRGPDPRPPVPRAGPRTCRGRGVERGGERGVSGDHRSNRRRPGPRGPPAAGGARALGPPARRPSRAHAHLFSRQRGFERLGYRWDRADKWSDASEMTTAAARDRSSDCANRGGGRFAREPPSMRTSKVLRCGADRLHVWGESPWIAKTPTAAARGSSEPRTGGARRRPLRGPAGPQEGRRRFLRLPSDAGGPPGQPPRAPRRK